MDILAIRGPLPKNCYGIMGNLAIPCPLVKPLLRLVQIMPMYEYIGYKKTFT